MKTYMCEQGTPEWLDVRAGIATASEFNNILTPKQGKLSEAWKGYAAHLISERLIGTADPWRFEGMTADMRRGVEFEPEARDFFSFVIGEDVQQVGFCVHDNGQWGASPDGLLTARGLELKCPSPKTQIEWVYEGKLPDEHKNQCHGGMVVTGLDEWLFGSYCHGCPSLMVEVKRDDWTKRLEEALHQFNGRMAKMLAVVLEKRAETIDARIRQRNDQTPDIDKALVPPSAQLGSQDSDPFGPALF